MLFRADQELPIGTAIQLSLGWPVKLENRVELKLIVLGRVVRTQGNYVGVEFHRYEFRTRASRSSVGEEQGRSKGNYSGDDPASIRVLADRIARQS